MSELSQGSSFLAAREELTQCTCELCHPATAVQGIIWGMFGLQDSLPCQKYQVLRTRTQRRSASAGPSVELLGFRVTAPR